MANYDSTRFLALTVSCLALGGCSGPTIVEYTDGDTSEASDGDTGNGDGDGDTSSGDGDGDTSSGDGDGDDNCGNGVLDEGELCDDGLNDGSYGGCAMDCSAFAGYCGDANTDNGDEECDDGMNNDNTDGCYDDCTVPTSCLDILTKDPGAVDGMYEIGPADPSQPFAVYCDMTHDGGGWTRVLWEDYSEEVAGWTNNTITSCGSFGNMLGGFGVLAGTSQIDKMVSALDVTHTSVRMAADYYAIDSWDNEPGFAQIDNGDVWTIMCAHQNNSCNHQMNGNVCGSGFPDGNVTLDVEVAHASNNILVSFGAQLEVNAENESYGVGDLAVYVR